MASAERERVEGFGRLEEGLRQAGDWYLWGPYVSERQWGTVREDYSADGDAWAYLPHDHARSRAYRWGEDGMAGFCDVEQRLCLGLALWNGRDPILKERMFGLTGAEANHGEDVKEYWWYLDAVPSHAWNRWRYHYPQAAFPYDDLLAEQPAAGQARSGVRAARHRRVRRGPVLDRRGRLRQGRPQRPAHGGPGHQRRSRGGHAARAADRLVPQHLVLGRGRAQAAAAGPGRRRGRRRPPLPRRPGAAGRPGPGRGRPDRAVLRERDQQPAAVRRAPARPPTPRTGSTTTSWVGRPPSTRTGTAPRRRCGTGSRSAPAATVELRLRLRPDGRRARLEAAAALGDDFDQVVARRRQEADAFYAELTPPDCPADEAMVMRQAFAGMLWSKQLYAYDVARWLTATPTQPPPPAPARRTQRPLGQLRRLRHHVDAGQVGVPLVRRLGPGVPLRRPGPSRPGVRQVPAAAVVPGVVPAPQRGPAGLRVGLRRRQPAGAGVGGAGGVRHRRRPRPRLPQPGVRQAAGELHLVGQPPGRQRLQPVRGRLPRAGQHRPPRPLPPAGRRDAGAVRRHRLDGVLRPGHGRHGLDPEPLGPAARPSTWCSSSWSTSPRSARRWTPSGVWDETDGFYYDKLVTPDGTAVPVKVRSMVGIIPLLAAVVVDEQVAGARRALGRASARLLRPAGRPGALVSQGLLRGEPGDRRLLLGVVGVEHLAQAAGHAARRDRVPVAARPAGPVRLPPRASLRAPGRRRPRPRSTTSRPSRPPPCSAATPTGAGPCGSRSTTC